MHYRAIDLLIYVPLLVTVLVAWRMSVFRCAIFMGRFFFAFLIAMWLFSPLARITAPLVDDVALPYFNSIWFFVLWVFVWALFPLAVNKVVKPPSRDMSFIREGPGRILTGLVAGWFAVNALAAFLVMIPEVEGMYFVRETYPILRSDRRAARLYSSFTFTAPGVLLAARKEAAAEWVFQTVRREGYEALPESDRLGSYFWDRYRNPWATEQFEDRRIELHGEVKERLSEAEATVTDEQPEHKENDEKQETEEEIKNETG